MTESVEKATLGGGCFWCLEAVYQPLRGVSEVVSGYAGGHVDNPSYEQVCSGATGHAEVVQVSFDPTVVCYRDLLLVFFTIHDPTTLNRQGADVGTQYRSAIYYDSESQKRVALSVIAEIEEQGVWSGRIVTEVAPLETFWEAEEYHKDYYLRNRNQPYCRIVIDPKVAKLRKEHLALLTT
jgi:peptide-methionine (S)-S-oxide reductase